MKLTTEVGDETFEVAFVRVATDPPRLVLTLTDLESHITIPWGRIVAFADSPGN